MSDTQLDRTGSTVLLASLVKIELPKLGGAVTVGIERDVAEYGSDATGRVHTEVERGVGVAVRTFADALGTADLTTFEDLENAFRRIGRLEAYAGRSHDTVQAAYRSAERHISGWFTGRCRELGIRPESWQQIEAQIGVFVDKLARLSAEGYAEAVDHRAGEAKERENLLALVLTASPSRHDIHSAAARIQWKIPSAVRVIEFGLPGPVADAQMTSMGSILARDHGIIMAVFRGRVIAVADAAEDLSEVCKALPGATSVVAGPSVPIEDARLSAGIAHRVMLNPSDSDSGLTMCDDILLDLCMEGMEGVPQVLASSRLRPLQRLSIAKRVKLGRLLSAWLEFGTLRANVPSVLDKSRHTLRYQTNQLEKLFGADLSDRDARVELIIALRSALPKWELELYAAQRRSARAKVIKGNLDE